MKEKFLEKYVTPIASLIANEEWIIFPVNFYGNATSYTLLPDISIPSFINHTQYLLFYSYLTIIYFIEYISLLTKFILKLN